MDRPISGSEFEQKINLIFDLIFKYGIKTVQGPVDIKNPKGYSEFLAAVHKGFSLAQQELIQMLLLIDNEKGKCKQELKEGRKQRNSEKIKAKKEKQKSLENQEAIVRKLADSIAWQLFGTNFESGHHIARRLYLGEPQLSIKSSNLKSGIEWTSKWNAENPLGFALLSDLTTFIQIGDVISVQRNKDGGGNIGLIELKEGKANDEVRKTLDFFYESRCERALYYFAQEKGEKYVNQLTRMAKQDLRGLRAMTLLNEGRGIDPGSEAKVIIPQDVFMLNHYEEVVFNLMKKCEDKGWAIDYIRGGLMIGVYMEGYPSTLAFKSWVRKMGVDYPIIDFRQTLFTPLTLPPFLIPFSEKEIKNLVMGRKRILMCLNFDEWFKNAKDLGIEARWLSTKESSKSSNGKLSPYKFNERAIEFKLEENRFIMGDGILARIFFELVEPISALLFIKHSLEAKEENLDSLGEGS